MTPKVKITVLNRQKRLPVKARKIRATIHKIIRAENTKTRGEITISFVNDRAIRKLNAQFHNQDCVTDVLAFNLTKGPLAADIVISTDTAIRNAKIYRTTPDKEMLLYVVHGLLHLLGYNDSKPKQTQLMRKRESRYVHS